MDYQKQAEDFLSRHNITFQATRKADKLMKDWDNKYHACYRITLKKQDKYIMFDYHASLAEPERCTAYDILTGITKYDPKDFEDFISNFGYEPATKGKRIYNKVIKEWERIKGFFTDEELKELREIN